MVRSTEDSKTILSEKFPASERLKKRREFLSVQQRGRVLHLNHFMVAYLPSTRGRRIGITVSSKVGKAVQRTRLKRLFREVWRRKRRNLPDGRDYVFIARKNAGELDFHTLAREFDVLIHRLDKKSTAVEEGHAFD